ARRIRPAAEGRAEQALVPREGALHLPALAVLAAAEAPPHLAAVAPLGPPPPLAPAVHRDDGRADAELLAAQPVGVLGVEGGVGQEPVPGGVPPRGYDGLGELGRVVTRPGADDGGGKQVALRVAGGGELGVAAAAVPLALAQYEVAGGVAALQPGGIDGRL